ncbi:MAG: ABC transporter substrate-binding protein, partial [Chloroflexota bacterium]|nr:ABC transporter substrate-binding protein [Chloroflexota bacterium]
MHRAAQLGIAAPVIGVMLHATSDLAFGAPNPGRASGATTRLQQTVPSDKATAPEGTPQSGGTLSIGTNEEPDTLNPYVTQLVTSSDVLAGVMSRLLKYDSTQQLQPDLATGYEISEDGLTYTFNLRGGVKFHNGDPFTAQDVI